MSPLDIKDRKILAELDMKARMPLTQLARKVGLSRQVVEYRLRRMQKEGVILGAKAVFDSAVAGFNWYRLALRLLNITKEKKGEFIHLLKNHKNAFWVGEAGEDWDIVVNFICRSNQHFNLIFEDIISKYNHYLLGYEILIYLSVSDYSRSYLLLKGKREEGSREAFRHEMKYNPSVTLDDLDKQIIKEVSQDAWITNLQLGKKLGVSGHTVANRLKAMEENKLLLGYRLFINPGALGYQSYMLFLSLDRLNMEREKVLLAYLKMIPQVTFAVKNLGKWRITLEVEVKDAQEFQEILVALRGRFSDIITDFDSFPLFRDHLVNYFPRGCWE